MKEIVGALASQMPVYAAIAKTIVDERLKDFEGEILEKFSSDKKANPEAFQDPDFQYLVRQAQHTYARSGDQNMRDVLIDLIKERSSRSSRTRLSLSLNSAVEKAGLLTHNEIAELSLCFLLKHTLNPTISNIDKFAEYFQSDIAPLLPDISLEDSSYQYLEAQGCANINVGQISPVDIFRKNYPGLFSNGFKDEGEITQILPVEMHHLLKNQQFFIPCLHDPTKLQLRTINKDVFKEIFGKENIEEKILESLWKRFEASLFNREDFIKKLKNKIPEIENFFDIWDSTPLKQLTLTATGIAIGHSNLIRLTKFNADLEIWIK